MLFNSYAFILFLPIVWMGYFFLNRLGFFRMALGFLVAASFVFYGYGNFRLCFLLAFSIGFNYVLHLGLTKKDCKGLSRKLLLAAGLLGNLGLLYYFKYLNFTLDSLNRFFSLNFSLKEIVLPLGISFYTFQQISLVIDSYENRTDRYPFLEYSVFVSFFAQLIAGPIVLHQELIPQLNRPENRKICYGNMLKGTEYFILGFAKKVIVADRFALVVKAGLNGLAQLNSLSAVLTILAYTLEIYFDFSGYCDMALGIGYLFNLELPINFSSPYKSLSVTEFWKRWHITLSRFFTTYLYFPLGGSRKGLLRACVNIMIVFTVSGLWHGAAWTFVLWGMLHGFVRVIEQLLGSYLKKLPKLIRWAGTFLFVNVAWVFFRAEYFRQPFRLFRRVLFGGRGLATDGMVAAFWKDSVWQGIFERFAPAAMAGIMSHIYVFLWFAGCLAICVGLPSSHEIIRKDLRGKGYFVMLALIFAYAFLSLSQVSEFIYFNF